MALISPQTLIVNYAEPTTSVSLHRLTKETMYSVPRGTWTDVCMSQLAYNMSMQHDSH